MIDPIWLIAAGLAGGARWEKLALLGSAIYFPWLVLPALAVLAVLLRTRTTQANVGAFPIEVGAQLRAGRSLRQAVSMVSSGSIARLAQAGVPFEHITSAMPSATEEQLMAAAAVRMADRSGGRSAEIFDALGIAALETEAIRREQKAAAAPALMAATIVGGLPAIFLAWLGLSGRLSDILHQGGPVAMLTIGGAGLVGLGVTTVVLQARRSR